MNTEQNQNEAALRPAVPSSALLDGTWQQNALKYYFRERPGFQADTVQILGHFKVTSILQAVEELIKDGWLGRTNSAFPKIYQRGV